MKEYIAAAIVLVALLGLGFLIAQPVLSPKMKVYIVATSPVNMLRLEGSSISTKGGCSILWKGNRVDTVICVPHIITEDDHPEVPLEAPPQRF